MIYSLHINLTTSDDKIVEKIYSIKEAVNRALEISKCDNVHHVYIVDESPLLLGTAENGILTYIDRDLPVLLANE